jgi:hypothetical protein
VNAETVEQPNVVRFGPAALRRLARMHARAQGADEVAQRAAEHARALAAAFQEALAEACEELGVGLPKGQVGGHIDWRTGTFSLDQPGQRDGHA